MVRKIRHYLSLKHIEYRFTDVVSGKQVWLYRDKYGEYWLKDSRWSLFRCPAVE